jgi:hypothetical protein
MKSVSFFKSLQTMNAQQHRQSAPTRLPASLNLVTRHRVSDLGFRVSGFVFRV